MKHVTAADLAKACGGVLTQGNPEQPVEIISTDSREGLSPNGLFVPLIGAKTDGHKYIAGAVEHGAVCTLCSEDVDVSGLDIACIRVEDTEKALFAIALFLRKRLNVKMTAVTGSVGKTTTREMTGIALSAKYQTFRTEKNFNSQYGVPIMLSRVPEDCEAVVLEAGISEFGEMDLIAPMIAPDVTIMTMIGVSHLEFFKTRENIFREKFKLAQAMKPGSYLIVNGDNDLLGQLDESCGYQLIRFGFGENNDVRATALRRENGRNVFDVDCRGEKLTVSLLMAGEHMILDALAALAAASVWGVPLKDAAALLEEYAGYAGRQAITEAGGIRMIEDFYNASPDSMRAALSVLSQMECDGKKIAVLADMKELGEDAEKFHAEVGRFAASKDLSRLICVGELAREIAASAFEANSELAVSCFDTNREAYEALEEEVQSGDLILFKGSNSMNLKEICAWLKEKRAQETGMPV
ncbi:MAG: UDP-N-acetylmuramoyl-tripeptide--D-alanyl-D-alanine ligase [Lachnospiraceae bacterium]|nr:UDP-N-acetylmuramoyl-tripeptide--D-alanyl-D-alanine ligase [Lachnospiraceae bacterium]